jgi:hypothetical protein
MQILHGGLHVLVPHHLFDLGQVHALSEQFGGEGVAGAIEFEVRGDRRQLPSGGCEVTGLDGRGLLFGEGRSVSASRRADRASECHLGRFTLRAVEVHQTICALAFAYEREKPVGEEDPTRDRHFERSRHHGSDPTAGMLMSAVDASFKLDR